MIGSFRDNDGRQIFLRKSSRRYGSLSRIILRKLLQLDAVVELNQLQFPPGNRLEALRGNRPGQHSIRVNDQFRICFIWREGYAQDIEIADYH